MTQEQAIIGILVALAAFISALTLAIKTLSTTAANVRQKNADAAFTEALARAKVAEIEAENERTETTTQGNTIKVITDRMVKTGDENSDLHRQLRECEVSSKEKDGIITELRRMNTTLGERNEQQAKLLMDSAGRIKALEGLESHLRNQVTAYEIRFGKQLDVEENDDGNK